MNSLLFDWTRARVQNKGISNSFSDFCLFDAYLTEPTSYLHFEKIGYWAERGLRYLKSSLNAIVSSISLFNGCWTEFPFGIQGESGKLWQFFGDQTEEISKELKEA